MDLETMKRFKFLEHTADAGVIAYGSDLKATFANAAYGLFSLMADLRRVRATVKREVQVSAGDLESLLVAWLNELLYLCDAEGLIFKRFDITHLEPQCLTAQVYGEKIDPARHRLKTAVKAATYHALKVEKGDGYRAQVIFDL